MLQAYWLSRSGGAPEGPFAESQLRSMWVHGLFSTADELCADGSEDWMPAGWVMDSMEAPPTVAAPLVMPGDAPPVKKRQRRPNAGVCWFCGILGLVLLFFFWPVGLLLLVVALLCDKKITSCCGCGNTVPSSSELCPSCGRRLKGFV